MFRVGTEQAKAALDRPGATQVMMGTRPMKGIIFVAEAQCDQAALAGWVVMALEHISGLPPK